MPGKTATNGMVYTMEGLPQPPMEKMTKALAECPEYKTLTEALKKADLAEMLMGMYSLLLTSQSEARFHLKLRYTKLSKKFPFQL